jgi:hypothetical protein
MMLKHTFSKQRLVCFVISSHKRKRKGRVVSLAPIESQPHILDTRLIPYIPTSVMTYTVYVISVGHLELS